MPVRLRVEGWPEHSQCCDRQCDAGGGRQHQSDGLNVDGNRLIVLSGLFDVASDRSARIGHKRVSR